MRVRKLLKISLTISVLALVLFVEQTRVFAEQINLEVTGNGSASENTAAANVSNTTTVEQSNTAEVNNNVNSNVDTGNNAASDNTGGTTGIQTGSASDQTTVSNTNINTNSAEAGVGGSSIDASITENGSDSTNNIDVSSANSVSVNQNNNASINNSVESSLNTGNNEANGNNGDVRIETGDIRAETSIVNDKINKSKFELDCDCPEKIGELKIKISGNGSNSVNDIKISDLINKEFISENHIDLINNVIQNLNTGNNSALFNNGDVFIKTGGILSIIDIENKNINENEVKLVCDEEKKPPKEEEKPPVVPVSPVTPTSESKPDEGGKGGEVKGASAEGPGGVTPSGEILPITGSFWLLLGTLLSLIFFLTGWYLRMRPGRAPPALAFS